MDSQELKQRTKAFAHRCVRLAIALPRTTLGGIVRAQLMRCSTSVASNYRAVCLAQSKAAFVAKMSMVLEEADESLFWLEFIVDERLMTEAKTQALRKEADELTAIFYASRRTSRGRED